MQSNDHTNRGLIFIATCVMLAMFIYVSLRSARDTATPKEVVPAATAPGNSELPSAQPEMSAALPSDPASGLDGSVGGSDARAEAAGEREPDPAWTQQAPFDRFKYADYPSDPFDGPVTLPGFQGGQHEFATFKTVLIQSAQQGPDFAGYMRVAAVGCGTQCTFYFLIDERDGHIYELPAVGADPNEESSGHGVYYREDSNLLFEQFSQGEKCILNAYVWAGGELRNVATVNRPSECE